MLNVEKIRGDFPILKRMFKGKRLAYLDNAATTQKPVQMIEAMDKYYFETNANVNRGTYALAEEALEKFDLARKNIAAFIGAAPDEIIFTNNATGALNTVAGIVCDWAGRKEGTTKKKEKHVLLTKMDHHSNIVPWQLHAKKNGLNLKYVNLSEGRLDMEDASKKLALKPKIFSFVHVSNVSGAINDAALLCKQARENGALSCLDATQSVPHIKVDVEKIGCDFLAFSGHKILGPTGVGVLYMKKELQERLEPFFGGGGMILDVGLQKSTWAKPPQKFEAGTANAAGVVGLGAAINYVKKIGIENISYHERKMARICKEELEEVKDIRFHGNPGETGIVSFNVGKVHAHDVEQFADYEGVAIRAGHHCAMPLMRELGEIATARASFYIYNKEEEIERLVKGVTKAQKALS